MFFPFRHYGKGADTYTRTQTDREREREKGRAVEERRTLVPIVWSGANVGKVVKLGARERS